VEHELAKITQRLDELEELERDDDLTEDEENEKTHLYKASRQKGFVVTKLDCASSC
jgi:hypothetical protein